MVLPPTKTTGCASPDTSQDYRVIALDLPGFGASSKPAGSYDIGTQTERLADIIDALGLDQLHLMGNSMGGHISALYAARHPTRIRSLTLLDNAGITSPQPSELRLRLSRGETNPLVVKSPRTFNACWRSSSSSRPTCLNR